ncbi:hypothetical protein FOZ62_018832 [Perkinsus olseni]|uniref:Uncharacterized protein n=1 Tax=Perkinsus olseni TaxID=32597 RepID=A0A7J6UAR0_PEROL|nr:hypothetical protein FOZ62_018832 [Perkinsus olseni]
MGISFITAVLAYRVQSDYFFEQFVPTYAVSVEHRVSQRLSAASRSGINDYGAVGRDGRRETFRAFSVRVPCDASLVEPVPSCIIAESATHIHYALAFSLSGRF